VAKPAPKKKQVSFCEVVVFRTTISRHELSSNERSQYWFKKADFKKMRRDDKQTLDSLKKMPTAEKQDFCTRGLEKHIANGKVRYSVNVLNAKISVLEEQRKQKDLGLHDPESLRYVYQRKSNHCRQEAVRQGSKDAFDSMFPTKFLLSQLVQDNGDESHLVREAKKPRFEQHETEANLSIVPVSSSHMNATNLPIAVNATSGA